MNRKLDLISVWTTKTQHLLAQILTQHLDMARNIHFCGQWNFSLGKYIPKFYLLCLPTKVLRVCLQHCDMNSNDVKTCQWQCGSKTPQSPWCVPTTLWSHFAVYDASSLGLCTGTRFIVISVNRHQYHNRYVHSYSFDIHFDMFLTRYTWKMLEIYVFWCELCWKRLCWHVNCVLLRRREVVTACENSRDFLLRRCWESHSRRHFLNKTMFLL